METGSVFQDRTPTQDKTRPKREQERKVRKHLPGMIRWTSVFLKVESRTAGRERLQEKGKHQQKTLISAQH